MRPKRLLSACLALALCLSLLPATALAADGIELYVGGQQITESGCYENQSGTWTKVEGTEPDNGQFYYDADTITLTLNGAEISHNEYVTVGSGAYYYGSVIAFSQTADVSLKIVVSQGTSTITGNGGIRVESTTGNASLSIKGSGSLDVEPKGSNSGITLCSSKNTNLDIDGADVTASSPAQYGVYLISSTDASSTSTITVNNGSLTTGGNGNVGIYYYWSGTSNAGTSSLTVSGNAVVDTRNSQIMAQNKETVVQVGAGSDGNGGIVFNGKNGTVYGDVELQENLEIGEDETLTIGKDASLTVPDGKTLTNNGTVTTEEGGTLTGNITNAPPKITTTSLSEGTVNTAYNQLLAADNYPTNWSITSGSLPTGLTLDESTGEISGTPTADGTFNFTVKATNDGGSDSETFSLTVNRTTGQSTRSSGSSGGSGSSYQEGEYDFWMEVKGKIEDADPGDTVKANARGYDRMPWSVMEALADAEGVTLHITWNGGEEIVIPSEAALREQSRIYYPLSYLEGLDFSEPAEQTGAGQTGSTVEVEAPASNPAGWQPTAPTEGQTQEQPEPEESSSQPEREPASEPATEPETQPEAEPDEETMAQPESGGLPLALILGGSAAVIAAGLGFWFWKRRSAK